MSRSFMCKFRAGSTNHPDQIRFWISIDQNAEYIEQAATTAFVLEREPKLRKVRFPTGDEESKKI